LAVAAASCYALVMDGDRSASLPVMPSLQPGTVLGRYQLLCVVAQGGMGAVWAARMRGEHGFERKVAIKTILPQHAQETRFRKMFLDEARLASRIIHANVVQVLDLAEQDGVLYHAMEWVEGDSLRALITQIEEQHETFSWPVAVRIILEIAKGLQAAHELQDEHGVPLHVVHRDVSPQNIMLGLDGSVRISDFGIAKARDRLSPETSTGHIKGKLQYMAPEQALGKPIDRRADVWSLAAILYELLSGRPLFDAPNEAALLYEVVSSPPTLLFEEPIHPRLIALLRRAVARNPEGRHPTAEAFANDLRRAAKDAGIVATTEELAGFFQRYLAKRCEARTRTIESTLPPSVTLASAEIEVVGQLATKRSSEMVPVLANDVDGSSGGAGSLTRLPRSVVSDRRLSMVAGIALIVGVALTTGWFLLAPRERPTAARYLLLQPPSFPLPSLSPPSPVPTETVAPPAASDSAEVEVPKAPTTGAPAPRPSKRPPSNGKRPQFEDIDDGF
jgi:hypothetical protein